MPIPSDNFPWSNQKLRLLNTQDILLVFLFMYFSYIHIIHRVKKYLLCPDYTRKWIIADIC